MCDKEEVIDATAAKEVDSKIRKIHKQILSVMDIIMLAIYVMILNLLIIFHHSEKVMLYGL